MKKTLIALLALSGIAGADTTWTFDNALTSSGTKQITANAKLRESYVDGDNNTQWQTTDTSITYVESGLIANEAIGKYVLTANLGQAVDLTTENKYLVLPDAYYSNGSGKLELNYKITENGTTTSYAGTNFTVMAYVKFASVSGEQFFFGTGSGHSRGIAFGINNGNLDVLAKSVDHNKLTSTTLVKDTWYHLAFTYSNTANLLTFYVNGDSVGSLTPSDNVSGLYTSYCPTTNEGAAIGAASQDLVTGSIQGDFNGHIAELKLLNSTLTQSQILNAAHLEIIPEPTTATLSLLALAGLAARRRRK